MRRKDRLFRLMQLLKGGRVRRAEDLAEALGVSVRTIYRDMDVLIDSGVPIEGARGLGYRATEEVALPPMLLTLTELEALHLGLAAVGAGADEELKAAVRSLSAKLDAALPEDRQTTPAGFGFSLHPFAGAGQAYAWLPQIRAALRARQKLRLAPEEGAEAETLRPLKLEYWGRVWVLTGWAEEAEAFRQVRVDRIAELRLLPELFVEEEGRRLVDFEE
ncbi:helix-turn-helix transcriptional regulator [Pseudoroseicyclus tamaricis]|uniref:HTH domain-containing protein n=1 Tax=Pseudoroseicyclus tamaricis TaxID=2705421 RepID=A0A6B2JX13_9RHOB|nr:HTH domain-containing protein [Pseudoroseicyclus tamaricis]NDV00764.1 HTH domain-containing protein [Pseudoroseicyclus tamaricis]